MPAHHTSHLTRRQVLGAWPLALALPAGLARAQAAGDDDATLRAVIAGDHRNAANRARDAARHPYETLRFFGLRPEQQVVELAPGGGWYTEIVAPYLREPGRLWAAHYATTDRRDDYRKSRLNYEAKLAADPARYGRVCVGTLPASPVAVDFGGDLAASGGADLVLTFRNLHNWLEDGSLDLRLQAVYSLLKPGGVFGVVDHRAPPGTTLPEQSRSGYLTEALTIERITAAGFALDARSEINANPRDTHDHPNGVWSLPPTLRGGEVDRARFLAIGESDRYTHRYRKTR